MPLPSPAHRSEALAAAVEAWRRLDGARAACPSDRGASDAVTAPRAHVVDRAMARAADPTEDELFDACAVLGRQIARTGGSATLASWTADHAGEALGTPAAEWVAPARAAVVEGYVAELADLARRAALEAW